MHPMERHFLGPPQPVIRVVEVPLLNAGSFEELEMALVEGTKCYLDELEKDSEIEDSDMEDGDVEDNDMEEDEIKEDQPPLHTKDMNLPQVYTCPNLPVPRKGTYLSKPDILRGMPVRASFQPSRPTYSENYNPMTSRTGMPRRMSGLDRYVPFRGTGRLGHV